MNIETDIVKRNTVDQICAIYKRTCKEVTAGYKLLDRAGQSFRAGVHNYGRVTRERNYCDFDDKELEEVLKGLKRDTWRGIVARLNVRGVMCTEERNKLDKQLETGDGLPEIDAVAIMEVIESMIGNIGNYATGAIKEAFNVIRRKSEGYKSTEESFKIGEKAVLTWITEHGWSNAGGKFRVRYGSSDTLTTIENAFRMLAGQGPGKSNSSELETAINASKTGEGETEFFRFRGHKNMNLHIWFRRMDLVKEINELCGGEKSLNKAA